MFNADFSEYVNYNLNKFIVHDSNLFDPYVNASNGPDSGWALTPFLTQLYTGHPGGGGGNPWNGLELVLGGSNEDGTPKERSILRDHFNYYQVKNGRLVYAKPVDLIIEKMHLYDKTININGSSFTVVLDSNSSSTFAKKFVIQNKDGTTLELPISIKSRVICELNLYDSSSIINPRYAHYLGRTTPRNVTSTKDISIPNLLNPERSNDDMRISSLLNDN